MSKIHRQPYFLTPGKSSSSYPLFVFLPGLDETGRELMCLQTAGLETAFDVRCFSRETGVSPQTPSLAWTQFLSSVVLPAFQSERAEPLPTARRSLILQAHTPH